MEGKDKWTDGRMRFELVTSGCDVHGTKEAGHKGHGQLSPMDYKLNTGQFRRSATTPHLSTRTFQQTCYVKQARLFALDRCDSTHALLPRARAGLCSLQVVETVCRMVKRQTSPG